nr:MAG TPA: protein of unknown function (UPF0160) [Caudoviricetes sp.]
MSFKLVNSIEEANAITHDGIFHADEVFATALLSMLADISLLRTRSVRAEDKPEDVIMYDVGGQYSIGNNVFDHHQRDFNLKHEDGTKLSSFGLLWFVHGMFVLGQIYNCPLSYLKLAFNDINNRFVKWIDGRDNGQLPQSEELTISSVISNFNAQWDEGNEDDDERFTVAVNTAYAILEGLIKTVVAGYKAIDIVEDKIAESDSEVLNLGSYVGSWQAAVLKSKNPKAASLLYCTYKGKDGSVCITAVPPSLEEMTKQRKPFPEEWAGLSGEKLEAAAGIKGLKFCHAGRFFMSVDDEEVAQEVLKKIL